MERKTAADFDPDLLVLFDAYVHGHIDRRGFLRGTGVGVCSVVGFPLGATTADVKNFETRRAIFDGASEIERPQAARYDFALAIHDHGGRRTTHPKLPGDFHALVEQCRKGEAV